MSGFFLVTRGISKHHLFKRKPDRLAVWMWLLDNAAFKDTTQDAKGKTIPVPRGSVCASLRHIADETGVGLQVVRTALKRFESDNMIDTKVTHGKTVISLCNYEKHQQPKSATNTTLTQDQHKPNTQKKQGITRHNNTLPYGSDGQAVDFTKEVFDRGVAFLGKYGASDRKARSLIGMWRSKAGDTETFNALRDASREGVTEPVAWITARLKPKPAAATDWEFNMDDFKEEARQ